jgi:hypothetical protein
MTTSAERMRRLRERREAETSGVASEPGVASTSRAAQAMDIDTDSEQSTYSQTGLDVFMQKSFDSVSKILPTPIFLKIIKF